MGRSFFTLAVGTVLCLGAQVRAQSPSARDDVQRLDEQIARLRTRVQRLESLLRETRSGSSSSTVGAEDPRGPGNIGGPRGMPAPPFRGGPGPGFGAGMGGVARMGPGGMSGAGGFGGGVAGPGSVRGGGGGFAGAGPAMGFGGGFGGRASAEVPAMRGGRQPRRGPHWMARRGRGWDRARGRFGPPLFMTRTRDLEQKLDRILREVESLRAELRRR